MSEYTVSRTQLASTRPITNNTSGPVGYTIPELKLNRLIQPNEEIEIAFEELLRLWFLPGGKEIIKLLSPETYISWINSVLNDITLDDMIEESVLIENPNSGNGSNEPLIVRAIKQSNIETLDHTWQQIYDAFHSGKSVILIENSSHLTKEGLLINIRYQQPDYFEVGDYECEKATDYPTMSVYQQQ